MDQETARYILIHFPKFLTEIEAKAIRHNMSVLKMEHNPHPGKIEIYKKNGWLSEDTLVLDKLKEGYVQFEIKTATRILEESGDKIFLNKCPMCAKLARTPQARQCRHCGNNWHAITVAQFLLNSSLQLENRGFYIVGQITKGQAKIGNFIDLTMIGINAKPRIKSIEILSKRVNFKLVDYISFGTDDISEDNKQYMLNYKGHGAPFDIVSEK